MDCDCLEHRGTRGAMTVHAHEQDTSSPAWKRLLELIDQAADDGRELFAPAKELGWDLWSQIHSLPHAIAKLTRVKHLLLYGSSLHRVPPEVGEMVGLENFDPYTSYRLHWFPYEIIRCPRLVDSTVSTRAIYGNRKTLLPFPDLTSPATAAALKLVRPGRCSVCRGPFRDEPLARWTSRRVATDTLPLLLFACSHQCVKDVPEAPDVYLPEPHTGGRGSQRPRGDGYR